MNALVVIETLTPAVFSEPGGIDALLSKLETDVRSVATDVSTKSGREAVASLAYKISRSKTALDAMGKKLGEDHHKAWKSVCGERARIEARLDALRDEVRKPLDDYEAAEDARIAAHQNAIQAIIDLGFFICEPPPSTQVISALISLEALPAREWQEFKQRADSARSETFAKLIALKESALKREAEIAELERLRAEQVARERQEHEARIAAEAAARATREAEAKAALEAQEVARVAAAERLRIDTAKVEAVAAQRRAERDAAKAIQEAADERRRLLDASECNRLIAIETERKRVADIAATVAAETRRRESDQAHRKEINSAALAAFVAAGLTVEQGVIAITAIVKRTIPHIRIEY